MSIYRCAYCGSPNLRRSDNKSGFSYKKAIAGTAVFGAVGAVAGINGKEKFIYVCPDCGEQSDSPMDDTEKMIVDSMLRSRFPITEIMEKYPYLEKEWKEIRTKQYQGNESFSDQFRTQSKENENASRSSAEIAISRLSVPQCIEQWNEFSANLEDYLYGNWGKSDPYQYLKDHMGELNALAKKIATGLNWPVRESEVDSRVLFYHIFVTRNNRSMTPYEFFSKYSVGEWGDKFTLFIDRDHLPRHIKDYRIKELMEWFENVGLDDMAIAPLESAILNLRLRYSADSSAESVYADSNGSFSGKSAKKIRSGLWYEDGKLYISVDFFQRKKIKVNEQFKRLTDNKVPEFMYDTFESEKYRIAQKKVEILKQEKKLFGKRKAKQMQFELEQMEEDLRIKEAKVIQDNNSAALEIADIAKEIGAVQLPSMKDDSYWYQLVPDEKYEAKINRFRYKYGKE